MNPLRTADSCLHWPTRLTLTVMLGALICINGWAQDRIELNSGITLSGTVVSVSETTLTVEITAGSRKLTRKFPLSRVKAITVDGQPKTFSGQSAPGKQTPSARTGNNTPNTATVPITSEFIERSPKEIQAIIDQLGRTPPDWFEQTILDFPATLDLTWPDEKPPTWNYTRHIEHYIWDIINSNPARYRNGLRFLHHLLEVNRASPTTIAKIMNEMGRMYFEFFNDYARAAFWWQNAKITSDPRYQKSDNPAHLAECYWRLGNRDYALQTLEALPLTFGTIKLWGDLSETDRAISLAKQALANGLEASEVHLLAGDALRNAERFEEAISEYRSVLGLSATGPNQSQIDRNRRRAEGTIELINLFDRLNIAEVADGEYEDKSYGYAGNVELKTSVTGGRLTEIKITSLTDKQYFHAVDATIKKIIRAQSVKGVDAVSGATVTSEAVIRASAKALAQGTR